MQFPHRIISALVMVCLLLAACGAPDAARLPSAPPAAVPALPPAAPAHQAYPAPTGYPPPLPNTTPIDPLAATADAYYLAKTSEIGTALVIAQTPATPRPVLTAVPRDGDGSTLGITRDCIEYMELITLTNCWLGVVNGERTFIAVGANKADSTRGALLLLTQQAQALLTLMPPTATGQLTIVAAQEYVLTIHTASGGLLTFDVRQRTWGSAPPTATATPSIDRLRTVTFEDGAIVNASTGADAASGSGLTIESVDPLVGGASLAVNTARLRGGGVVTLNINPADTLYTVFALRPRRLPPSDARVLEIPRVPLPRARRW